MNDNDVAEDMLLTLTADIVAAQLEAIRNTPAVEPTTTITTTTTTPAPG